MSGYDFPISYECGVCGKDVNSGEPIEDEYDSTWLCDKCAKTYTSEDQILGMAIAHYGEPAQVVKAIEELAELTIELGNILFSKDTRQKYSDGLLATCRIVSNASDTISQVDDIVGKRLDIDIVSDGHHEANYDDIISEMADVSIMLDQLKLIFDPTNTEFTKAREFKLNRLKERIEGGSK